jgi:hypothetical protein
MVYTHVLKRAGGRGIESPADALFGRAARARTDTRQLLSPPKLLLPGGSPESELSPDQEDEDDLEGPDEDR